jgi:translation initiation factor RLI1
MSAASKGSSGEKGEVPCGVASRGVGASSLLRVVLTTEVSTRGKDQRDLYDWVMREMDLAHVADRDVELLSGGELQRFAIGIVVIQTADVYMFDEPSSYLDVKQRQAQPLIVQRLPRVARDSVILYTYGGAGCVHLAGD